MPLNHEIGPIFKKNHIVHSSKKDIFDLIHQAQFESVRNQIEKGEISLYLRNKKGQTLLEYANIYKQDKIAKFLISKGAALEDKSNQKINESYPNIEDHTSIDSQNHEIPKSEILGTEEQVPNFCILS